MRSSSALQHSLWWLQHQIYPTFILSLMEKSIEMQANNVNITMSQFNDHHWCVCAHTKRLTWSSRLSFVAVVGFELPFPSIAMPHTQYPFLCSHQISKKKSRKKLPAWYMIHNLHAINSKPHNCFEAHNSNFSRSHCNSHPEISLVRYITDISYTDTILMASHSSPISFMFQFETFKWSFCISSWYQLFTIFTIFTADLTL